MYLTNVTLGLEIVSTKNPPKHGTSQTDSVAIERFLGTLVISAGGDDNDPERVLI